MPTKAALLAYIAAAERLHAYLDDHPQEWAHACGKVAQGLTVDQMGAALWMNQHFGMEIDVHNLQKLIQGWDHADAIAAAALSAKLDPPYSDTEEWISSGEFDPNQLIDYLVRHNGP
jgi:hypothetical protein